MNTLPLGSYITVIRGVKTTQLLHDCNTRWHADSTHRGPRGPKNSHLRGSKLLFFFFSMSLPRYITESKLCTKLSKHCKFLLQSVSSKLSIYSLVFPYSDHNIFQYRSDLNILSPRCTIRYHTMVIFTCTQCYKNYHIAEVHSILCISVAKAHGLSNCHFLEEIKQMDQMN